jgi:DNA invertase Pin-like site-specific DNA recombinase
LSGGRQAFTDPLWTVYPVLLNGLSGTTRAQPGLDQALPAVRPGRHARGTQARPTRSVPDARAIGDALTERGTKLSLGGQLYDPADPMSKMFFNILATFA